jgi:5-methyltetrahydropteroyltriglutamate--homocysteine methyltransferase
MQRLRGCSIYGIEGSDRRSGCHTAMTQPVRAHHVGSLLRPAPLREAFRGRARGELSAPEFQRAQDHAIRQVVAMQERLGLRLVTDGEFRRASYWAHFVDAVEGLEVREALFSFTDRSGDRLAFTAPHVVARVRRARPISAEELEFLKRTSRSAPKITLPSPSTMHFWRGPAGIESGVYGSVDEFFEDLAAVYREEIRDLADRGAHYLQIDEVALAMLCDRGVRRAVRERGEDPDRLVDR